MTRIFSSYNFLSSILVGAELKYKPCHPKDLLAHIFIIHKQRHYIQAFIVWVVSKLIPVKFILSSAILNG